MDSLAAILRSIPLFADLPPGSFARIIADLREEQHEPGAVICYEGDEARDFYIIKSGQVEVQVNLGGTQREVVAVSGPSEWFGERALFSDQPRAATVVTRTEVELWRLPKDKFDAMIEENPWLMFHFAQILSDRLYKNNQELSKLHEAFSRQMDAFIAAQPRARQDLLTHTAILNVLDPEIVEGLVPHGDRPPLSEIESCVALVSRQDGVETYLPSVREYLLARLGDEVGAGGMRRLHQAAANLYTQHGRWDQAITHWLAAEEFTVAAELVAGHLDEMLQQKRLDLLSSYLEPLPADVIDQYLPNVRERLETALHPEDAAYPHGQRQGARFAAGRVFSWTAIAFGLAAGLLVWTATPPQGLDAASMRMIALLVWAATLWAFDALPDYVVSLAMLIGWIVFDVVPTDVAVSGFTTSPFFLIIGVLGIAASLQSSGLLFRIALHVLQRFPLTHRGQSLGLALTGTAISSVIPDTTSGVAIAGTMASGVAIPSGVPVAPGGTAGVWTASGMGLEAAPGAGGARRNRKAPAASSAPTSASPPAAEESR